MTFEVFVRFVIVKERTVYYINNHDYDHNKDDVEEKLSTQRSLWGKKGFMSFSRQTQRTMAKNNNNNNNQQKNNTKKNTDIRVEQNQRRREKNKEEAAGPSAEMIVEEPPVHSYLALFLWH